MSTETRPAVVTEAFVRERFNLPEDAEVRRVPNGWAVTMPPKVEDVEMVVTKVIDGG